MNELYYGAFDTANDYIYDFIDALTEDVSYKLDGKTTGDVYISVDKEKGIINFTINNIYFTYDGHLSITMPTMALLRANPYPLYMMVNLFHQMYRDNSFEAINEDDRFKIARMAEGFLLLRGWFDDPRVEEAELEDIRLEEKMRECDRRENAEFWEEYYEHNPNDI